MKSLIWLVSSASGLKFRHNVSMDHSSVRLDRWFRLAVILKGLDGIVEALCGAVLLAVPAAAIRGAIATLATNEIQEDKRAFIAHSILTLDQKLDVHVQLFVAIYLLAHGLIKIGLATALLKRYWRLYPYAIGFLLAFIVYQAYLIGYNRSLVLIVLTLFDCTVAALAYTEWRRHRRKGAAAAS